MPTRADSRPCAFAWLHLLGWQASSTSEVDARNLVSVLIPVKDTTVHNVRRQNLLDIITHITIKPTGNKLLKILKVTLFDKPRLRVLPPWVGATSKTERTDSVWTRCSLPGKNPQGISSWTRCVR